MSAKGKVAMINPLRLHARGQVQQSEDDQQGWQALQPSGVHWPAPCIRTAGWVMLHPGSADLLPDGIAQFVGHRARSRPRTRHRPNRRAVRSRSLEHGRPSVIAMRATVPNVICFPHRCEDREFCQPLW